MSWITKSKLRLVAVILVLPLIVMGSQPVAAYETAGPLCDLVAALCAGTCLVLFWWHGWLFITCVFYCFSLCYATPQYCRENPDACECQPECYLESWQKFLEGDSSEEDSEEQDQQYSSDGQE